MDLVLIRDHSYITSSHFWDFILKRAPKIYNQMKLDVETILS